MPPLDNGGENGEFRELALILDCGAQFAKVIDRRCREIGVETRVESINKMTAEEIKQTGYKVREFILLITLHCIVL